MSRVQGVVTRGAETAQPGSLPWYRYEPWAAAWPWLRQGITARGRDDYDLGLFGNTRAGDAWNRWAALRARTGCGRAVHGHQIHGAHILRHAGGPAGLLIVADTDGHVTSAAGVLLTVSTADCVPIYLVDAERRVLGLLHAGWRGVAAGVLPAGLAVMARAGAIVGDLHVHLGPAICGGCYEVGPEVQVALGLPAQSGPGPVNLRDRLLGQALRAGIAPTRVSVSTFCTLCNESPFYSHRGGDRGRQMAFLGWMDPETTSRPDGS